MTSLRTLAKINELEARIVALEKRIKESEPRLKSLPAKKKPGRPRKDNSANA